MMLGVIDHDGDRLTLRQVLWRMEGKQYHDLMQASHIAACNYNTKRTSHTDKIWHWKDLHPMHASEPKPTASGRQVIHQMAAMGSGEWSVLPGYDVEGLLPV